MQALPWDESTVRSMDEFTPQTDHYVVSRSSRPKPVVTRCSAGSVHCSTDPTQAYVLHHAGYTAPTLGNMSEIMQVRNLPARAYLDDHERVDDLAEVCTSRWCAHASNSFFVNARTVFYTAVPSASYVLPKNI